jgi:hypothetical protein
MECVKCKPANTEKAKEIVANVECNEEYLILNNCMKQKNGSISQCSSEWAIFRSCFEFKKDKSIIHEKQME